MTSYSKQTRHILAFLNHSFHTLAASFTEVDFLFIHREIREPNSKGRIIPFVVISNSVYINLQFDLTLPQPWVHTGCMCLCTHVCISALMSVCEYNFIKIQIKMPRFTGVEIGSPLLSSVQLLSPLQSPNSVAKLPPHEPDCSDSMLLVIPGWRQGGIHFSLGYIWLRTECNMCIVYYQCVYAFSFKNNCLYKFFPSTLLFPSWKLSVEDLLLRWELIPFTSDQLLKDAFKTVYYGLNCSFFLM